MMGISPRGMGAGALLACLLSIGCAKKDEGMAAQPAGAAATPQPTGAAEQPGAVQPPAQQAAAQPRGNAEAPLAQSGGKPSTRQGAGSTPAASNALSPAPARPATPVVPVAPPPPRQFTLAAGTSIQVRTVSSISTKTAVSGDRFEGTLARDLEVDGYVVAPKGSTVVGSVTESDPGGRVKGVASVVVALTRITDRAGTAIEVHTQSVSQTAQSSKKKDALKVGIGAGIGAAIGAIAGGGKGAAIGAGAGGAAGTGVVLATRGDAATIPSETVLSFRLSAPVTVTEKK